MNKRFSTLPLWFVMICLALMTAGCPEGGSDKPEATLLGTWPETPFSQELARRYDLAALGVAGVPVFMDADVAPTLDQDTRDGLVQAFENGQPIVMLDAFQPDLDMLLELLGCDPNFTIVVGDDDDGGRPAIALCKTLSGTHSFEAQTEGSGDVLVFEVNGLVNWLDAKIEDAIVNAEKASARDDITDLVDKPSHTWTYTDDHTSDHQGSSYNQVTAQYVLLYSCTNQYWVAGVWMTLETQVVTKPRSIIHAILDRTYGYAMYADNSQSDNGFDLPASATTLQLNDINPGTDIGTTSYSSGLDFSIGGEVDTSGAGSFSSGVTFSNSVSHDIPTIYIYEAAQLLQAWPLWFFYPSTSYFQAGGVMSYNTSWAWTIPDNDDNSDFLENGGMTLAAGTFTDVAASGEEPLDRYHDPSDLDKFTKHTSRIVFGTAPKSGCGDAP